MQSGVRPSVLTDERVDSIRTALLPWSTSVRRDLPWRRTRDPWAVLVSEVMLQQTQVARVIPKWEEFLERFPTAASCADAPQADVVRLWEGLGYHRRAMNLHRAAKQIVTEFGGVFPRSLSSLESLSGVGPYTARAVLAFAFEDDAAVVDTNVGRIIARALAGRPVTGREAQRLADQLVPLGDAWAWNQGLLDLGATVCTKRLPKCPECPLASSCVWACAALAEPDPATGSAHVSGGQSRFVGSDRQGRGRFLAALRKGPVTSDAVGEIMGWPDDIDRANRVASSLVTDGLVRATDDGFELH